MRAIVLAGVALAAIGSATSASAAITFYVDDPGAVQPDENVQYNDGLSPNPSNPFLAQTNQGTGVTFTSDELLFAPSSGQARITGDDGGLTTLTFFLTDLTKAMSAVEFDLTDPNGTHGFATVDFYDQFGAITSTGSFQLGQGSDWVSAVGDLTSVISKVTITTTLDLEDVRQVRITATDVPLVPEPATWAMMIAGFGFVGGAMRRQRAIRVSFG